MATLKIVTPGPGNILLDEQGRQMTPPSHWDFLPAGDAGVTRKVTAAGEGWRVQVKMGRCLISKGIWAPKDTIQKAILQTKTTRNTASYIKKMESVKLNREKKQEAYVEDFQAAVTEFLHFHPCYATQAAQMATLICAHATPVGSGTVARTQRIPIEERAAKATIAWMRHQTTAYDDMQIARIKGERRRVRRMLAERSVKLLESYRKGEAVSPDCPLQKVLR